MRQVHAAASIASRSADAALLSDRLTGLAIIAGLPTMLWTSLIYVLAWAWDQPLGASTTAILALSIFSFLVCIWAAFALAEPPAER